LNGTGSRTVASHPGIAAILKVNAIVAGLATKLAAANASTSRQTLALVAEVAVLAISVAAAIQYLTPGRQGPRWHQQQAKEKGTAHLAWKDAEYDPKLLVSPCGVRFGNNIPGSCVRIFPDTPIVSDQTHIHSHHKQGTNTAYGTIGE
jgi:hypothetical protein